MSRIIDATALLAGFAGFCVHQLDAQWVQTGGPLSGGSVYALAVTGADLLAGTDSGAFLSTDNGLSWNGVNAGLTLAPVYSLAVNGTDLFAGTDLGGLFLSTDHGASWTADNTGITATIVYSLATAPASGGINLFAGTDGGVYHSTNNGSSWNAVDSNLTSTIVRALVVIGADLFAGTGDGGMFISTDDGGTWSAINTGLPAFTRVNSLAAAGTSLVVTTNGGLFVSSNNGANWTAANSGLPAYSEVYSLAVSPVTGGSGRVDLFVGTQGSGVFLSTDEGASWTGVSSGLGYTNVLSFAVSGSYLFAGTSGGGVWRRPLNEMIAAVDRRDDLLPAGFSLLQNYPNPFNPTTTIRYGLPRQTIVALVVFNALGQQVAQLVTGEQEPGYHQVEFNAWSLSSGTYFYRLTAGTFKQTKRLLLLR